MDDVNESYFIDLEGAPKFTQIEGLETTVLTGLHGGQMMIVLNATLPGHSVPTHSHPHEQIGMVYRGRAILRIGDKEREVGPGDFYCIPGGVPHSDTILGDEPFVMLDIFYPVREDFRVRRLCESRWECHDPTRLQEAAGRGFEGFLDREGTFRIGA